MLNFNIYSHGYMLNRFQKKSIHDSIEKLTKKVPYDACINLDIECFNRQFVGKVTIKTSSKIFFAQNKNEKIKSVMSSINKKLLKQIEKWKKTRTKAEVIGVTQWPQSQQRLPSKRAMYKRKKAA